MKKLLVCIAVVLLVLGCMQQSDPIQEEQRISLQFMKPASIDIVSAKCRVSADDMDTILTYLTVLPTAINGEVSKVPYGEGRFFEIMCYSSSGDMNYYGSVLADISNIAPIVNITLNQVDSTANVTIIGTFGDEEETEEKIVFTADWNGDFNIYMMDTDGSNIKQMTGVQGREYFPRLSPDRSKILFQRASESEGPRPYILDVESLEENFISNLSDYDPKCMSWNPEGTGIVFHTNYNTETADIYYYDMITEAVIPLVVDSAINWGPTISPDGNNLIYYSNISGIFKAYIANIDGSNPIMIIPDSTGEHKSPRMNPINSDQFVIAGRGYTPTSLGQWGLFLIDRSDSSVTNIISTNWVDENHPIWSPDGEKIVYNRFDGDTRGIYIINKDGSENKALIDTPYGNELYAHWR